MDSMTLNLFADTFQRQARREELPRGAVILRAFALGEEEQILAAVDEVVAEAPPRHMVTPGGVLYVGRLDELRFLWLGNRSNRLSLPVERSG